MSWQPQRPQRSLLPAHSHIDCARVLTIDTQAHHTAAALLALRAANPSSSLSEDWRGDDAATPAGWKKGLTLADDGSLAEL